MRETDFKEGAAGIPVCRICKSHKVFVKVDCQWHRDDFCGGSWIMTSTEYAPQKCNCCGAENGGFKWIPRDFVEHKVILSNMNEETFFMAEVYAANVEDAAAMAVAQASLCRNWDPEKTTVMFVISDGDEDNPRINDGLEVL